MTFLGWLSDLQLGDEKVTLNHLVYVYQKKKGMPKNIPPIWAFPSGYPKIFFQLAAGDCISPGWPLGRRPGESDASPQRVALENHMALIRLIQPFPGLKLPETNRSQLFQNILHMLLMVHAEVKLTVRTSTKIWRLEDNPFLWGRPISRDYFSFRECSGVVTESFCWADLFWFQKN